MYSYCVMHSVFWTGDHDCLECIEEIEGDRPLTDDELMEAGYPPRHAGNDDRHQDTY